MEVVILAGGRGTRLAEMTEVIPKPMVEIGGRPILWHIMRHYAAYGHKDFFVALGYKGDAIKHYFVDYCALSSPDMTVHLADGRLETEGGAREDWTVHLIETGLDSFTGDRVRRLRSRLPEETFMVTYGDGVADIDLDRLLQHHRRCGKLATVTAVRPPARFGSLEFDGDFVTTFAEKSQAREGWINGGFLVLEPAVFDCLAGEGRSLEADALTKLAAAGQLAAYRHEGFWQCMDTMRDKELLERLWQQGNAPWKVWS